MNQQQRKERWEKKPGMLLTELQHVMKHQKASGRQRVCYGLFCFAIYS
jgi:hypothetical protein